MKRGAKRNKGVSVLEPGWQGIFVTCPRGRESNCRAEMNDVLADYIEQEELSDEEEDEEEGDIESLIKQEVQALGDKKKKSKVDGHLVGCECVVFMRIKPPVDPVKLVHKICEDAKNGQQRTRYAQRLSPVSLLVPAGLDNIEKFAPIIEKGLPGEGLKFAIRPTIRQNTQVPRDELIANTAKLVGHKHKVDLKGYDKLILVECFKSVMGVAVVDDFEEFKRFNLSQLAGIDLPKESERPSKRAKIEHESEQPEQPEQPEVKSEEKPLE